MSEERTLSPLEMCDPEPVWCGTEEEKYVPFGEEQYYNTSMCLLINDETGETQSRKTSIKYEKFMHDQLRWRLKYADYNGLTASRKAEDEKYKQDQKYYKFCLGESGRKVFEDFISKYRTDKFKTGMNPPDAYVVYVITPTSLGDIVTAEVRRHLQTSGYEVLDKCEVYNEI